MSQELDTDRRNLNHSSQQRGRTTHRRNWKCNPETKNRKHKRVAPRCAHQSSKVHCYRFMTCAPHTNNLLQNNPSYLSQASSQDDVQKVQMSQSP